jgi:type III secretory pathway component EscT
MVFWSFEIFQLSAISEVKLRFSSYLISELKILLAIALDALSPAIIEMRLLGSADIALINTPPDDKLLSL